MEGETRTGQRQAHGFAIDHALLRRLGAAFALAATTGILAQIKLYTPLTPVPYTLQVFGVALMGGLLGRRWGSISASLYLLLGLVGLPVFAGQVADAGGLGAALSRHDWNRGLHLIETAQSAGFLFAYVPQAWIIGWARDRAGTRKTGFLVGFAPATLAILTLFAALDAVALADASKNQYYTNGTQAVFFAVLVLGLLALAAATAWLAHSRRHRHEGLELFFGNVAGLAVLYLIGATWFFLATRRLGLPSVTPWEALRYGVFPFIAVDIAKILLAIGLVRLWRRRGRFMGLNPSGDANRV